MPRSTKLPTEKQTRKRAEISKSDCVNHAAVQLQLTRVGLSSSAIIAAVQSNADAEVIGKAHAMASAFTNAARLFYRNAEVVRASSGAERAAILRQAEDARVAFVQTSAQTEAGARAKLEAVLVTIDDVTINAALISAIRDAIVHLG